MALLNRIPPGRCWSRWFRLVRFALGVMLAPVGPLMADDSAARESLLVAVHVHSIASTGSMSVEAVAQRAEQLGLDAVVFTENFSLRYEYGLPPLRQLVRVALSYPSLLEYGIERYLREVAEVQARHPKLILLPGIEAAPYAYWTGSLWSGNLTLHDTQKNILVFGLTAPGQHTSLPAHGNVASYRHGWQSFLSATLPLICLVSGAGVMVSRRRAVRYGRELEVGLGWSLAATALLLLGLTSAWAAWPLGEARFAPYDSRLGVVPYQAFLDEARAQGGLTFWSMTEARDYATQSFGPLGTVTVRTEPHPDMLMLTHGYTGFGGLYQDAHHAVDAGGVWDHAIEWYLSGGREAAPVMLGESAFHSLAHARKDLDQVLSVVSVERRDAAGLLAAIRTGRLYAVERQKKEYILTLDRFELRCEGRTSVATAGDHIESARCAKPSVSAQISSSDGVAHPVQATVIRSGRALHTVTGSTPLRVEVQDVERRQGAAAAYRLLVRGSGEIVTNPIFLTDPAVSTRPLPAAEERLLR